MMPTTGVADGIVAGSRPARRSCSLRAASSRSMFSVTGSQSTRMGIAPRYRTISPVAAKVIVGISTPSPGRDSERFDREVQRRGARVDRDGVPAADRVGELALELPDPGTGGQPARPQSRDDLGDFFLPDRRTEIGDRRRLTCHFSLQAV